MSTRSLIGVYEKDAVGYVYCHYDGYVEGVGKGLITHFNNPKKAKGLLKTDIRSIDADGFVDYFDDGEVPDITGLRKYNEELANSYNAEFLYLYTKGAWYVNDMHKKGGFKKVSDLVKPDKKGLDEDGFDSVLSSLSSILLQARNDISFYKNKGDTGMTIKYSNKIKEKVVTVNDILIKNGFVYHQINSRNEIVPMGKDYFVISANKKGNYIKLKYEEKGLQGKGFYYVELYIYGELYKVRLGEDLIIEKTRVKRKPNNINKVVNHIYK